MGGARHYKYKIGESLNVNCSIDQDYSNPRDSTLKISEQISNYPDTDMTLCVLGLVVKNGVVERSQPLDDASIYEWKKDTSGNVGEYPIALVDSKRFVSDISDGSSAETEAILEIRTQPRRSFYRFKFGDSSTVDCLSIDGYSDPIYSQSWLILDISMVNPRLCLLGVRIEDGIIVQQQPVDSATEYSWQKTEKDITPPDPFDIIGPAGVVTGPTPTIQWQAAAGADYYDLTLAGDALCQNPIYNYINLTATSKAIQTPLATGSYFICVTARDLAGNRTPASNNGLGFNVMPAQEYHEIFATSSLSGITSSQLFPPPYPNFGNVARADWICNFNAFNAGKFLLWDGQTLIWKALISDSNRNARDAVEISGPLYNTQGDLLAVDAADLWDGTLTNPVRYDETGSDISGNTDVWSGSDNQGHFSSSSCNDWQDINSSGQVGDVRVNNGWLSISLKNCSGQARLYCISPPIGQ